jgi:putative heme-binding domain-containing protein
LLSTAPLSLRVVSVRAIAYARPPGLANRLKRVVVSQAPNEVRTEAIKLLAQNDAGIDALLDLEQSGQFPPELRKVANTVVSTAMNPPWWLDKKIDPALKRRADRLFPPLVSRNKRPLPPIREILSKQGNPEKGKTVFAMSTGPKCASCHSVGGARKLVGPDLATIGSKLGKDALLESILNPSAGIAPEFHVWILETKTQGDVVGVLIEDTPQRVTVRTDANEVMRFKPSEITSRRRSRLSLMPEDLATTMTEQQLVDLLAYLSTLKDKNPQAMRTP